MSFKPHYYDDMSEKDDEAKSSLRGTLAAFGAYGIWGFFPLYWKQLSSVESLQILFHRIFWAAIFCLVLLAAKGRLAEIKALMKDRRRFALVLVTSVIVTCNWYLYIWAVNSGRVMQSALGYYINPLLSVVMGMLFFHEKADRWIRLAVLVATAGIVGAAIAYRSLPWMSLLLGLTFATYGALKKRLALDPLLGLTVETLAISPIAIVFLLLRHAAGTGAFWSGGAAVTILLTLAGIVTAIPLLGFAIAANSISLQRMGFIQYVSPTLQLFIGLVIYGEKPSPALIVAFVGVILAVFIYIFSRRRSEKVTALNR